MLLALVNVISASALIGFQAAQPAVRLAAPRFTRPCPLNMRSSDLPNDDGNPDQDSDEYSVDWDGAWSTELAKRKTGTSRWRPEGREPLSEKAVFEAHAKRATDDALVTVGSWTSDWKLWVGLLLAISIVTAVASHPTSSQIYSV